jgi:HK97 family phage major capsid protein
MDLILELKQQVADLVEEQKNLVNTAETEDRDLNEEEESRFNEIDNKIDKVEARIARLEKIAEREKKEIAADNKKVKVKGKTEEGFRSFGEFLQSVAKAGMGRGVDKRLVESRAQGLNESIPSEGGFLVGQDFVDGLIKRTYETAVIAPRCRKIGVGENANGIKMKTIDETSRANGARWGGIRAYWENEASSPTATEPKFGRFELNLEKLMGLCYATDELLEDANALGQVIEQGFSKEFGFKLDDAIIRGDGAGKPLGLLNSDALVSVSKESSQEADTLVYENITNMWSQMWARSRSNAIWTINQDVEPQLFSMKITTGTGGFPVYLPPGGASSDPYARLMGRPVVPIEQASTLGDQGDIMLIDPSQYLLIDKGNMQSAVSIHVRFIYAENTFRFIYRVNGQPMWDTALTPYKGANDLSPFVALAART